MSKVLYLDFEFNRVTSEFVNLVSCATLTEDGVLKSFWLHNNKCEKSRLVEYLKQFDLFIGYSTVAEARSFLSLGINPLEFNWNDLFLEYRMVTNSNDNLQWGNQLVDGKVKSVTKPKPKWERLGDEEPGFKATHSLAEATYKLLGKTRDTEHKTQMRDLIISDPDEFTLADQQAILDYGEEDVRDLPKIKEAIEKEIVELTSSCTSSNADVMLDNLYIDQAWRGRYSAHTAIMENRGYPIDYDKTRNFSRKIPAIMYDVQREINKFFPEIKPFKWNRPEQRYSMDQKAIKGWVIKNHDEKKWPKTESGAISLKLESFTKFYDFKHDYPENNFGAQVVRFLKLKQSLYGFSTSKDKKRKSFWDSVGPDQRVRPYTNHYGAQTSRTQPGATGFMFLKPAWMRALVAPPRGMALGGIDYSSVEFFIQALISEDEAMMAAYLSGDVYLAFAIQSGLAPDNATKETHKTERDMCKTTVLGIGFNMTKFGLAINLSANLKRVVTEDEAQEFIDKFDQAYPNYKSFRDRIGPTYKKDKFIPLQDGWAMWGDNDNARSVGNMPIQGCIHGDSRVLVKDKGYQKISDIVGSHRVSVWDGSKYVSADCIRSGKKKKTIVRFTNGSEIVCSPDHKFLCVSAKGKETWKEPKDFQKGQRIRKSGEAEDFDCSLEVFAPPSKIYNGKNIGLEHFTGSKFELGVFLGRLASDGWVSRTSGVRLIVAEHEKEIIEYLVTIIRKFGIEPKVSVRIREESGRLPVYFIVFYSHRLQYQLVEEIKIKYSLEHPYLWHSKELMRGFLAGYMDGDGGVSGPLVKISFGRGESKAANARLLNKMFHIFGVKSRISVYSYRSDVVIRNRNLLELSKKIAFINSKKKAKVDDLISKKGTEFFGVGEAVRIKEVVFTDELIEMYDIANCPEQKFMAEGLVTHNSCAVIMRRAVDYAVEKGLEVIFTLHDALYIQYKVGEEYKMKILADCMKRAFIDVLAPEEIEYHEEAKKIRMDPFAWSPDYEKDSVIEVDSEFKMDVSNIYIDSRSFNEYEKFSQYFDKDISEEL